MANQLYRSLLESLATSASPINSEQTVQGLLSHLDQADPNVRLVAQYLAQQQAKANQALSEEDGPDHTPRRHGRPSKTEQAHVVHRLRRRMKDMALEIEELRERNDALAAALGVCYLCWGEDPDCEVCDGAGQSGYRAPDRAMFIKWVAPTLRKLRSSGSAQPGLARNTPSNQ
jgi:hypothetical protein